MIKTTMAFLFKLLYHLNCEQNMEKNASVIQSVIHYITEIYVILEKCLFVNDFKTNYATYHI